MVIKMSVYEPDLRILLENEKKQQESANTTSDFELPFLLQKGWSVELQAAIWWLTQSSTLPSLWLKCF